MSTAYQSEFPSIEEIGLRASVSDTGAKASPFASFVTGICGVVLIVFPLMIRGSEELTSGLFFLLLGMGIMILLGALWEAHEAKSKD